MIKHGFHCCTITVSIINYLTNTGWRHGSKIFFLWRYKHNYKVGLARLIYDVIKYDVTEMQETRKTEFMKKGFKDK